MNLTRISPRQLAERLPSAIVGARPPHHGLNESAPFKPLEAMVFSRLLDGDLKPGDPLDGPDELAQNLDIPLSEVLDSVSFLLSCRILRQDSDGNLFIHSRAQLSVEMRQQAFLLKARQLFDTARKWELPGSAIDSLIFSARQQESNPQLVGPADSGKPAY